MATYFCLLGVPRVGEAWIVLFLRWGSPIQAGPPVNSAWNSVGWGRFGLTVQ